MKRAFRYGERDFAFGQMILKLRTTLGLTQAELAGQLGVSRRAMAAWEAGGSYPRADHFQQFIVLAVRQKIFPVGREAEEIGALWKAARQKLSLDERWLHELLNNQHPHLMPVDYPAHGQPIIRPAQEHRVDWDDALVVPSFYGREQEMFTLSRWIVEDHCRVVSVLGMGGIGKSALATSAMRQLAPYFEIVRWRSLRDAPTCEALLDDLLQTLAPPSLADISASIEQRLNLLLDYFRRRRTLLVLDNLETLLEEGETTGHFRPGYEGYAKLLRRVAESEHRGILLLTSREKPGVLIPLESGRAPVRSLRLGGLDVAASQQLLKEWELSGASQDQERLIERYRGNPLALKIVAGTTMELFGGEIAPFLTWDEAVFGSVRELLGEQFDRLSVVEQTVLYWLAILRDPVTIEELLEVPGIPLPRVQVLEAAASLRRRSLLERGHQQGSFTLHGLVLEYVTARLIEEAISEIEQGHLALLIELGFELSTAREYVRQAQERLIVAPILARLRKRTLVEEQLLALLDHLRQRADYAQGYGPANVLALLRQHWGHLRGLDLSRLSIRGAYMQRIEMQDTTLAEASLRDARFTEALDDSWAVATSSDGIYWAAGGRRGEVRVWRQRGRLLHLVLQAHSGTVRSLAFSPDGTMLASASWDCAIKLWNLESGALLWAGQHTSSIQCLAFAPDGRMIASGGDDATVRLWDAQTGINLQTFTGHAGPVFTLTWKPDGRQLASGSFDGQIRLWDEPWAQSETSVQIIPAHTDWVLGLAFAPDGCTLASASWDRTVKLWNMENLSLLRTLTGHTDHVNAVRWSSDGRLLASCGFDQTIWIWNVERGTYQATLYEHNADVYDIAFTPDSRNLISGSEDGTLRLWDVERGQCMHILQGYAVSLYDVAWHPNSKQLASAGSDLLVTIWDVIDQAPPRTLRGHKWIVYGVAWSPDGRSLASGGWDNSIRIWDAITGNCVQTLRPPDGFVTIFQSIAWSPDGRLIASGSYQQGVQLWEVPTGTRLWVSSGQQGRIRRVAWSPDGRWIASGADNGSVFIWDAYDGTMKASLKGHRGLVMRVAWSPDGRWLASGGGGRGGAELFIWDVNSGERLYTLDEPSEKAYALAWNLTGEQLLSGGSDGMLRWWDLLSKECVQVRQGHKGAVQSIKISLDGRLLASCGDDNIINIWDLKSGNILRTLQRDRPYERLDISGVKGLSEAQRASLRALGAIEDGVSTPRIL